MKRATAALICIGLLICFGTGVSEAFAQGGKPSMTTLIVKTAKGYSEAEGQVAIRRHGGNPKSSIPKLDLHVLEVPEAAVEAVTKNLKGDPSIARVEVNRSRRLAAAVPSDTLLPNQWALPKIAWSDVYGTVNPQFWADVAVLDTGIDGSHPDLVGAIGPGTSVIDNSNGLTDPNGHGTWLAGIVAARTNNIDGIAGVGYSHVQVLPVKVLDADGNGQDSDIIQGVLWAADRRVAVILMAFSSTGFSESLQEAIDYAWSQGVVIVAAAGNDSSNLPTFPAGDRGVIGVSATDSGDNLYNASNYGPSVFLAAPGVDILGLYKNQSYVTWTGTSASAAIVAGVAAFMRAVDPSLSNGVVVSRIARTADPAGTQTATGNGRINMARALADTSTDAIQPAGAAPIGNGGPFVGPYRAAAVDVDSITVGSQSGSLTYGTGGSVTYAVTVSGGSGNGTLTISVTGLPAGAGFTPTSQGPCRASDGTCNFTLTVTTSATTPAGLSNFTVTVDPGGPPSKKRSDTGELSIGTKNITGSFTAQNKSYDGNTAATILTRSLTGVSPADAANVSLSGGTATFDTAAVGTGKTVTGTGFSLSGSAAGSYVLDSVATTTANITALHITGSFTADNKVYDGNTAATVLTRSLVGILGSDSVSLTGGSATFSDKAVANGKTVTLTGASLSGDGSGNYVLDSVATTTANITALHVTGSFTADNKVYDGNTSAVVLTRSVTGILGSDAVSLAGGTATFNNKTAANGKPVTLAGATLSGADAGNYVLDSVASATANITPLHITGSFTADNKVYDGNTSATVLNSSLAGSIAGDAVSVTGTAVFSDKEVANGKTVTLTSPSLTGTDSGNYVLDSVSTTTANITAKHITGTFTADNKVYDGTTSATALTRSLVGTIGSDAVTLYGGTAAFGDKTVADGKTVTLTGATLSGVDAGNYLLDSVATATANISALHVTGSFTADNKVYDGNTSAVVLTRAVAGILGGDSVTLVGGTATFSNKTVAANKPVTLAGATLSGADAGNYVLDAVAPATATITVLRITGTFTADNKVYNGTTSATVLTSSLAGIVPADTVSLTGTALFGDNNVGNGKTVALTSPSLTGADAGNYFLDSVATTTANITARHITGSFTAADKIYDGNTSATVVTRSLVGAIGGDDVNLNGGTATFDNKNVGNGKTVTLAGASLSGADAGNYALDSVATTTANITARHITGNFTAATKVYDGNTSATVLTRGVVRVLGGDAVGLAGGTATFNNKTVANGKAVTLAGASLSGADAGNYILDSVAAATADITPLHITGSFTANHKAYDGNTSADVMTSSLTGTISGDAVGLTGTPLFGDKNVGNGKTVTLTSPSLNGADAGNYVLDSVSSTTANITPLHITGSFTADNKVYDGNTSATVLTRSLVGAIGGDVVSLSGGAATFDNKNVGNGKTVTLSGASLNGGDALNYVLDSVATTTASITPLLINGSFTAGNKVYDGNTSATVLTRSVTGVLGGDAVTLVGGTATFNNKAVANGKPVILTGASLSGSDAGNYMLGSVAPARADITPLHITGSFTADNKTYDGNTAAAVVNSSLAGTIAGDVVSLGGTALFSDKNVGNGKTVTLTVPSLSGADAGNYALDSVSTTTANITAKHITGSFTAADKVYDGNTSAAVLTRSLVGAIGGDAVNLSGGTATFDNKDVGSGKTVTLAGAGLSGSDAGNYILDSVATTTANITALQISGSFTAGNKVYDGNTAAAVLTRSVTGTLGTDAVSLTGGTATFNNKMVANGKPVVLAGASLSGPDAGNYMLGSVAAATADITALHITGSFTADNKIYDGSTAATVLTTNLAGTIAGDTVSLAGTALFSDENVANGKTVTLTVPSLSGADAGNYALDSVSTTTANITAKHITGSFTPADKVYDGNTSAAVVTRSLVGAIGGDAVNLTGGTATFDNENVGNGKTVTLIGAILSGADMGNYVLDSVATTTANITALQVTGAFTAGNKVYDGNTAATVLTRSVAGILGGDVVTLGGGSASFNDKSVANGKPVTLSGASLSGADAGNYGLVSVASTTANITALQITGSFTAANKVYDGTIAATVLTSALTGTVSGDVVNLVGTATFNNKTAANGKPVTLSATGLAGADAGNYALDSVAPGAADITPALLTAKAMDIVRMFGDASPLYLPVQYWPFVAGETLPTSGVTGSPNVGTTATPASNAGLYPIVWGAPAGVSATNYSIAFVGGTVTIVDQSKPLVTSLALSVNPVPNTATTWPSFTATISDATTGNSKIVEWSYTINGVAAGSLAIAPASQAPAVTVSAQLSAQPTGVYKICVQGKDSAANWSEESCVLLAVYDPNGGFVTGGGWIMSPAGAYTINPALTGKANFGFVSKTQKGASVPTGQTEFQFHVAKFEFKSTVYEWLVVNGTTQAQFKGSGTVNGSGNYGFLVTAVDGNNFQTPKSDAFRIKIWDKNTGQTIYDNQLGADENSSASTNLGGDNGGGSIVIHDNGKK